MLLPTVLCFLLGSIAAIPQEDFRSDLEFLNSGSEVDLERYRLRDTVYPTEVNVELDVDLNTALFTGIVRMNVTVSIFLNLFVVYFWFGYCRIVYSYLL